MNEPARKLATYDDLLALPANAIGQPVFGVLHAHARPAPKHARASTRLGGDLDGPFDRGRRGPGGWIILDEPEVHLGEHVLVSDLAGRRRERMPELPVTACQGHSVDLHGLRPLRGLCPFRFVSERSLLRTVFAILPSGGPGAVGGAEAGGCLP